jgi:iron complex outermembrane receptor protein
MAQSGPSPSICKRRAALMLSCLLVSTAASGQSLDYQKLEGVFDEPVTNSATGKPERVSDTPVTMDVITQDDIKRSGARDLATLLRLLPGVISYRGHTGTEAFSIGAILLNGREIYLSAFGELFLDSVPVELEEIRQIEVVRGPQSALYGFDSGDGVINIITFDPARDPIDYARGRVGNDARRDGAASVTINPAEDAGIRLTVASDHMDAVGFDAPHGQTIPPTGQDRRSFSANGSAYFADESHATMELSHSDVSLLGAVPEATLLLEGRLQDDALKTDYTADTAVGRVGALFSYTSLTVPEVRTLVPGGVNLHDRTADGRLNDLVKLSPDDSVRVEFEARDEWVHTSDSHQPVSAMILAGSAMWDHRFGDSVSMVNAVRYYDGEITHGFADNSSLIYRLDADDALRGSFARGLSLPSQISFDQLGLASFTMKGATLAQTPPLATWTNTEARITYDHQFRDWGASVRVSLFEQQTDDLMSLAPFELLAEALPNCNPPTPRMAQACALLSAGNGLSGTAQGAELEIEHKSTSGLTWGANYSIERIKPHGTQESSLLLPDLDDETLQKVNAHIGYGWQDWSADLRLLYTGPAPGLVLDTLAALPRIKMETTQPITTLSPRIGWQATDYAQIELSAENLWPYRLSSVEKIDTSYFLTVRVTY